MVATAPQPARPVHVVFLNWRDTANPEGGGSERYVENVAAGLAAAGHRVTVVCAAHGRAAADEVRDGVRFVRRGGKLTVYPAALGQLLLRRLGAVDVVVDVQNGIPFFSRLVTRRPVLVLVHHVHREQWRVVYGAATARLGWWIESRLAPRLYRGSQYVAVSEVTRQELVQLGVRASDVAVVHNGNDEPVAAADDRSGQPLIAVLGRLVPHKRVEIALASVARLRPAIPDLRLVVIGAGWWADRLATEAKRLGVADRVDFVGFVDEGRKHAILDACWVLAVPSLKEGWGLGVMEAASHGVPAVAFADAGGVAESIAPDETGVLVADQDGFHEALRDLLTEPDLRSRYGAAARERAKHYSWERTSEAFTAVLNTALTGATPVDAVDPGSRFDRIG